MVRGEVLQLVVVDMVQCGRSQWEVPRQTAWAEAMCRAGATAGCCLQCLALFYIFKLLSMAHQHVEGMLHSHLQL